MNKYEVYANANRSGESMATPSEGTGVVDAIDKSNSLEKADGPVTSRPLHHLWPWAISLILFLLCGYLAFLHPRAPFKTQPEKVIGELWELFDDPRPAIYRWAHRAGIGLECREVDEENNVLKGCVITTRSEREEKARSLL